MNRAILDYFYKASGKDIKGLDENGQPVQSPVSVRYFYEKVLNMPDSELERHELFRAFIDDDVNVWRNLYRGVGVTPFDERLLDDVRDNLNDSQLEAVRVAVREPVSLIQGPPGTGKTHMILALLYVLTRKMDCSVAVVSVNNEAIANITDEILLNDSAENYVRQLRDITAKLGNQDNKKLFNSSTNNPGKYVFDTDNGGYLVQNEEGTIELEFRTDYRIISSTPHSLMKLFSNSYEEEAMFDYVIVDETSQMSAMHGLIAMFPARHIVLVGDDKQIPPVISHDEYADIDPAPGFDKSFILSENRSFLKVVTEILNDRFKMIYGGNVGKHFEALNRILKRHYRCAPGIFDFCRRNFYNGAGITIEGETPTGNICPMRMTWYNGIFAERCYFGKTEWKKVSRADKLKMNPYDDNNGADKYKAIEQISEVKKYVNLNGKWEIRVSPRSSSRNMRQIQIFLEEEWDKIFEKLKGEEDYSVCILSPYKAQIYELRERLYKLKSVSTEEAATDEFPVNRGWPLDGIVAKNIKIDPDEWGKYLTVTGPLDIADEDDPDNDNGQNDAHDNVSALILSNSRTMTIHSAQGQGFDMVYLLPVDDRPDCIEGGDPPFAQVAHMVNVAVSRAKKELCLITSSQQMTDEMREHFGIKGITEGNAAERSVGVSGKRYVNELISYIYEAYYKNDGSGYFIKPDTELEEKYGFREAGMHTLFEITDEEAASWLRSKGLEQLKEGESGIDKMSLDEAKVDMFLEAASLKLGFKFDAKDTDSAGKLKKKYRQVSPPGETNIHMDFAIRDENDDIICFIEEDGYVHRYMHDNDHKELTDLRDCKELQKITDICINSRKRDELCAKAGMPPLIRWNSDSSHMLYMDGITSAEKRRRERITDYTRKMQWEPGKTWSEQIECLYEYVELELLIKKI